MEFQEEFYHGNQVRGYGQDGVKVNDVIYQEPILLGPNHIERLTNFDNLSQFSEILPQIIAARPNVLLVGAEQGTSYLSPGLMSQLLTANIGYEIMSVGAACRTYNILLAEGRDVLAVLLISGD